MAGIASYVFIKMSTTPINDDYGGRPKIIELSMVAVGRDVLEWKTRLLSGRNNIPEDYVIYPAVLNKLTLTLRLIQIPDEVDEAGRRTQRFFSEGVFNTIHNFLDILPKPVCLIAYNGMKFAFPILKSNFSSVNCNLPEDVLCSDLIYAAYDLRDRFQFDIRNVEYSLEIARSRVTREIFYNKDEKPEVSYQWSEVYSRLVRRELNKFENDTLYDCLRLLEIAVMLGGEFIQWVDYSHKRFVD